MGLSGFERSIPDESLSLVDWERVYLDLLEYKERKRLRNLIIHPDAPRKIIATTTPTRLYRLVADEAVVKPTSFSGTKILQEAVTNILRKYTDDYYRIKREQWESNSMVYQPLDENDPNLSFNRQAVKEGENGGYIVKVPRSQSELISAIQKLIADAEALYKQESDELPRIHFDQHLYQPLLVEYDDLLNTTPPRLKQSEAQFVHDLKEYWGKERDYKITECQVFLLRNLSRGSGIGFFEERGFYPDFILWIVTGENQHIIFIEPHGMLNEKAYQYDDMARLHEVLPSLAEEIGTRSGRKGIALDSYVISATKYDDLRKKYVDGSWDREKFSQKHILFMDRNSEYDYMARIFTEQLT